MSDLDGKSICFIGGGSMAEAIIRGLVEQKRLSGNAITVLGRDNADKVNALAVKYGIVPVIEANAKLAAVQAADIVVLSMKPKDAADAIRLYRSDMRADQLAVSVIAGLSIASVAKLIGLPLPIVRTMPNTSSSIGLGATGISFNESAGEGHKRMARDIFESIGIVCEVEEQKLDIVTGVSGSGPAYIYYVIESMIAGGISGGLDVDTARLLTIQTVLGAAEMLRHTGEDPAELRRKVTSPNGTTQAALELMGAHGVGESISKAVLRAAERAGELGAAIAEQIESNYRR